MPALYSRRWTQPLFPKRDGLQDDITRLRCGGRPAVLTQQKNKFETIRLLNPKHKPVSRIKKCLKSWQPPNAECYERCLKCDSCGGGYRDFLRIPQKPYRYQSLNDDDDEEEDDDDMIKLSDTLLDDMFTSWLHDDKLVETKIPEIEPPHPSLQHHMKHHGLKKLQQSVEQFNRVCCSECDYPYHLYKRRDPPHLYTPINIKLPIRPKGLSGSQKPKTLIEIDANASSDERLRWAVDHHQLDEICRLSTDLFASIVDDHLLRVHRIN